MIRNRTAVALALTLMLGLAPAASASAQAQAAPAAAATAIQAIHLQLPAPDGRTIDLSVWQAADEKAVVVFSHGFNGSPAAYQDVLSWWADHGFTVVAPLHVDSLQHPEHDHYDSRAAFITRIVDLAVARGFVKASHPGKPLVAAGHSFGSLMSVIEGGAVTAAGPQGDPDVRVVVAFSSAGDLPNLVTPQTYAEFRTPLLMITGDQDLVEGYVTDWRAHRGPFDRSPPGDKMLLVFAGGDHSLVRDADAADHDLIYQTTLDFMAAHALGDAAAQARLDALTAPDGVTLERR